MKKIVLFFCWWVALGMYAQEVEVGLASYYHAYFNGKKTANGELYDDNKLTAAHKTLPLGTLVKVTNLENDRSVIVRINDRGPYVKDRILDLSRSAAEILGYVQKGVTRVSYEIVSSTQPHALKDTATIPAEPEKFLLLSEVDTSTKLQYGIKVASYEDPKFTFSLAHEMKAKYNLSCYIQTVKMVRGHLYRVFTGNFATKEEAEEFRQLLKKSYPECYVISYENF